MARKTIIISVSCFLLLSFISFGIYRHTNNQLNNKLKYGATPAVINAADLYTRFQQNKECAYKEYGNKVIKVKGMVTDVQNNGSLVVLLQTDQPIGVVNCRLTKTEQEEMLRSKKGKDIIIKGRCACFRMDVNMVDCVVE